MNDDRYLKLLKKDIHDIGFSQYVVDCLYWRGYKTIGDIADLTVQDFMKIGGIGVKYCNEIVMKLESLGLNVVDLKAGKEIGNSPKKLEKPSHMPYPNNLIAAIDDDFSEKIKNKHITFEHRLGLSYALSLHLSEDEKNIVLLRYKSLWSLEEIGRQYRLSRERIRQIIRRSIEKLKQSRYMIDNGLDAYIEYRIEQEVDQRIESLLHDEYMRGYQDGQRFKPVSSSDNTLTKVFFCDNGECPYSAQNIKDCKKHCGLL